MGTLTTGAYNMKLGSLTKVDPSTLKIDGKPFQTSQIEILSTGGSYSAKLTFWGSAIALTDHGSWFGFERRVTSFGPFGSGTVRFSLSEPTLWSGAPKWLSGHLSFSPDIKPANDPPVVGVWGAEHP